MFYRPEIDGLRAVAVLPVILYHAGVPALDGGFIGVDVFFVISGYLITSILLDDLRRDRFSVLGFYERRARRILPALGVVLVACLPFAWAWMVPKDLEDFLRSLTAVCLFVSNAYFWSETDYFDTAAELKPLLHTWSLAVEEQFYFIFPLLLLGLWTFARRQLATTLWILAAISFALCLYLSRAHPSANFFVAPSRAWELLAGSLCALAAPRRPGRVDSTLALSGLILVLGGIFMIGQDLPFPSEWTLLPVGGAVLIIRFAGPDNLCGQLLASRPFVLVGLISYSAYLIHQPVFVFARIRAELDPSLPTMLSLTALSLFLAWLLWRYVEAPLRNRHAALPVKRSTVFAASATMLAGGLSLGLAGSITRGWESRGPEISRFLSEAAVRSADGPCIFQGDVDVEAATACLVQNSKSPDRQIVLLGDSHANAIAAALQETAGGAGLGFVSMTHNACFPIPGTARLPLNNTDSLSCSKFIEQAFAVLDRFPETPIVIMTRWTLNIEGTRFNNREGGRESGSGVAVAVVSEEGVPKKDVELVAHVASALKELSVTHPLVLTGPFPEAGWDPVEVISHRMWRGEAAAELSTSLEVYRSRNAAALLALNPLVSDRILVVDLAPLFCDTLIPDRCINFYNGVTFYSDDDHPSFFASQMIAAEVLRRLIASGVVVGSEHSSI